MDIVQRINIRRLRWLGHAVRRDGYLMRRFAEVSEEDDLVSVGRTKSRKPCQSLVCPTGVGVQYAKALEGCVTAGQNPLIGLLRPFK